MYCKNTVLAASKGRSLRSNGAKKSVGRKRRKEAEDESYFPSMDDSADEQDETMKYSPEDMDAMSGSPRSHLPSWPKKPPHLMKQGTKEADGYMYSNNNDPGAEAQAREDAERAYKAAMAEREEGFRRYMAVQGDSQRERKGSKRRQTGSGEFIGHLDRRRRKIVFLSLIAMPGPMTGEFGE